MHRGVRKSGGSQALVQEGRKTVEYGLGAQGVLAMVGCLATRGQKGQLEAAIVARGDLSETGLTQRELDGVVDLVYAVSLAAFLGLFVAWAVLLWGARRKRRWASFWVAPLSFVVLAYGVAGIVGDVVAPRARGPLLVAAVAAVVLLFLEARSWRREKSKLADLAPQ